LIYYALDDHHVVRLFAQGSEHVRERAADMAGLMSTPPASADNSRRRGGA
jgi:hypothetical protein